MRIHSSAAQKREAGDRFVALSLFCCVYVRRVGGGRFIGEVENGVGVSMRGSSIRGGVGWLKRGRGQRKIGQGAHDFDRGPKTEVFPEGREKGLCCARVF
eukprot:GFKZ01007593.1.p3 GENE.GFKZ01007593.1~~GFKZ01007593.1.p3  ORF type:complete len:100 (-),score=4.17 GFKZ01007593.1:212-511(-)